MRVLFCTLTAALLLTACNKPAPAPQANDIARDKAAAFQASTVNLPAVTGQINLSGVNQLPKLNLDLELRLLDVTDPSQKPVTVEQLTAPAPRRLPMDFRLPYHAEKIDQSRRYVIEAALLTNGFRAYSTALPVPVLTDGHAAQVALDLVRGGASAANVSQSDLTKREFKQLESLLGGMRRVAGKRIDGDISVGWDAFMQDNVLRMAREQVNLDNESRVSYRYAYKAGQPWVVIREKDGVTAQVGWDAEQNIVLNEVSGDGELSADEVAKLRARAEDVAKAINAG